MGVGLFAISQLVVYTIKSKVDGWIEIYKLRLVTKGFTQTYGIIAANYSWELQQFEMKNAFFLEELEEEIYVEVPFGYEAFGNSVTGWKLSPEHWFGN